MKRIINPSKYLKGIVEEGTPYYIGFGAKDLTELGKTHPGIKDLISGAKPTVILTGKKGPLRENTGGKYVRKQPESKTSIWKHIEYYSTKWEKWIEYDREYNIWEKELLHKFNLELSLARTPQNEIIFVFPMFIMHDSEDHYLLAGAAMNMACALSNYHLMYDTGFEPIIPVTKYKDTSLLPAGAVDRPVTEKLETIEHNLQTNGEFASTGNSERFATLKEQGPGDVTIGHGGFDGYLAFEYPDKNLIIFENLKSGNATYIFKRSEFDMNKDLDKQAAMKDKAFVKRIVHENMSYWTTQVNRFLN